MGDPNRRYPAGEPGVIDLGHDNFIRWDEGGNGGCGFLWHHPNCRAWVEAIAKETADYRELRARQLDLAARRRENVGVWRRVSRRERSAGEVETRPGRMEKLSDLVTREVRTKRGTRVEWLDHVGRLDGVQERHVKSNGRWHRARARGMREHVERVKDCGIAKTVHIECPSCGARHEEPGGCGSRLLCVTCRGTKNARARRVFLAARKEVLEGAHAAGLDDRRRRGGAFTEKFLTLTAPHLPEHGIVDRVRLVFRAWTYFLRAFNDWLTTQPEAEHVAWFRRFEWTQGNDANGHPHFHVWLFCPFLPARPEDGLVLQAWWCDALDSAARDLRIAAPCLKPDEVSIDVQGEVRAVERELVKYLVKEIAGGEYVAPERYARLFEALDGRRVTQASKGFVKRGTEALTEGRTCRECHAPVDRYRVAVRDAPDYLFHPPEGWDAKAADLLLSKCMDRGAYRVVEADGRERWPVAGVASAGLDPSERDP